MKVRFLKSTTVATADSPNGEHVAEGDEFEMDAKLATEYVQRGAAEALDGPLVGLKKSGEAKAESTPPTPTKRIQKPQKGK